MRRLTVLAAAVLAFAAHADPPDLAARIVAEGLAMRTAQPDAAFAEPARHRAEILQDIRAALAGGDHPPNPFEIRYAGWQIVSFWLAHGETPAEIAGVKPQDAAARVAEAIDLMLKEPRAKAAASPFR